MTYTRVYATFSDFYAPRGGITSLRTKAELLNLNAVSVVEFVVTNDVQNAVHNYFLCLLGEHDVLDALRFNSADEIELERVVHTYDTLYIIRFAGFDFKNGYKGTTKIAYMQIILRFFSQNKK